MTSRRPPRLPDRYIHELGIDLAPAETGSRPARADRPFATLRIDGLDILDAVEPTGWIGFPAAEQLGADPMPLLATPRPRWVGLAQCTCGIPGCGTLAALVAADGSMTTWTEVRRFVGVFDGPLATTDVRPEDGQPTGLPDPIRFDTGRYAVTLRQAAEQYRRGQVTPRCHAEGG